MLQLPTNPAPPGDPAAVEIISITAVHIANGICANKKSCPIALVINERHPEYNVIVGADRIIIILTDKRIRLTMSLLIQLWVASYDDRQTPRPITIQLDFRQRLVRLVIPNPTGETTYG